MSLLSVLFVSIFSQAYILEYDTIMSRTATNHGNGGYQIQQAVQWTIDGAPAEILETWTVLSESKMHLRLQGEGRLKNRVQGEIVYDTQKKTFKAANGQITNQRLPATFSPHFFHFRSSRWMRERMVSLKMAPPHSLQNRPPLKISDKPGYTPQDFLSLQRVGGAITFGIGEKSAPSLYIEQDQFVVTQIRFSPSIYVVSGEFSEHSGSFYYPQSMTYTFGDDKVTSKTRKVTYLGRNPKAESVQLSKNAPELVIPEESSIKEFYSTFR